jgi:glycosyltransferase involved in cell wall biosynthesis
MNRAIAAGEAAPRAACRSILMVGTALDGMGGISSVVRGYERAGFFERFESRYIVTYCNGGKLRKARAAVSGWGRFLANLATLDAPLVHIHLSSRGSFWRKSLFCLTARVARRPYLLHLHGSEFMKFYDEECSPAAQRFVSWIFGSASLVLALSEEWRRNVLRIAPHSRCEVLANAVALPEMPATAARTQEVPVIVALGRLGERKGTFDLLEACARLRHLPMRLICAGDGAIAEVQERARELGIADRVTCPGWLSPAEGAKLLSEASIFALPSRAEGLPMALLEAMSHALPVVTTPVGGIPQVVKHDENGVLVAPADVADLTRALASLLTDPGARERLGRAARATIEQRFSIAASIERLSEIYAAFGVAVVSTPSSP